MESALYVGGFILFILAGLRVYRVINLMSFSLRTPENRLAPMEEVPRHILLALAPGGRELRRLGFELSHCSRGLNFNAGIRTPHYSAVYYQPAFNCYVDLAINLLPDRDFPYQANFYSFFEDDLVLLTTNFEAYSIVDDCPTLIAQDGNGLTLEEQFSAHCDGIEEITDMPGAPRPMPRLSPQQFVDLLQDSFRAYTDFLADSGYTHRDGDHFRMRPVTAWRVAAELIRGEKAMAVLRKRAEQSGSDQRLDIGEREMLTMEVDAFRRHREVQENSSSLRSTKGVLLLITVLLFGVVFGVTWSISSVLLLIGVILFHELGHILAMRLCGYRDLQILFIPFLGAAAMGKADSNPRPWQKAFISLMGPLPGIVLGGLLAWQLDIGQSELLFELVVILLLVNVLNLLPIMPLDGGQLLNSALFSHYPHWEFGFYIASMLVLCGYAAVEGGPVLLVIAGMLALQIPAQYRHMRLSLALLETGDGAEQDPRRRVFRVLNERQRRPTPFAVKLHEARNLVERLSLVKPTALEATGCVAVYLMVLLSPMGFVGTWVDSLTAPYEVTTHWDVRIAATTDLPSWLSANLSAARDYMMADEPELAFHYLDAAQGRAEAENYQGEEYARVLEAMGSYALAGNRDAAPVYRRLLELRERSHGRDSEPTAQAHYLLAQHLSWDPASIATALRHAEESADVRRGLGNTANTYASLMLLTRVQESLERTDEAEATLREAVALVSAEDAGPGLAFSATSALADFYIRREHPEEALRELRRLMASPLESYELLPAQRQAATAHMLLAQGAEARELLQQAFLRIDSERGDSVDLDEFSFMIEGSPHRHAMELAATYWAEGDRDGARGQLERARAQYGDAFPELMAGHIETLRSWQEDMDGELDMALNNLLVDMAEDLELVTPR